MKSRHFCMLLLYAGLSALVVGCGGGSPGGSSGSSGGSGGGTSPALTVTSISPTSVAAGSGSVTLTVDGTGFLSTTVVEVNQVAEPTTYVSSTQVTATGGKRGPASRCCVQWNAEQWIRDAGRPDSYESRPYHFRAYTCLGIDRDHCAHRRSSGDRFHFHDGDRCQR
jgi:hypothetical protein